MVLRSDFVSNPDDIVRHKFNKYHVGGSWKTLSGPAMPGSDSSSPASQVKTATVKVVNKKRKPTPNITIDIESCDGTTYTITGLDPSKSTVADVQKWIQKENSAEYDDELPSLSFGNGVNLDDDTTKTLKELGIKNGSILQIVGEFLIFVQLNEDEMVDILVSASTTIEELKTLLFKKHKVSRHKKLDFEGKILRSLSKTIQEYGIEDGSVEMRKNSLLAIRHTDTIDTMYGIPFFSIGLFTMQLILFFWCLSSKRH